MRNTSSDLQLHNCAATESPDFTIIELKTARGHIKGYELLHNTLCDLRLQNCAATESLDFTITQLKTVLEELKGGKCADSSGFIREIFSRGGMVCLTCLIGLRKIKLSH